MKLLKLVSQKYFMETPPRLTYIPSKSYFLYTVDKANVAIDTPVLGRSVSKQDAQKFFEGLPTIHKFSQFKDRLVEVELNLQAFENAASQNFVYNTEDRDLKQNPKLSLISANQLCNNYLSSWYSFIEFMEAFIKKNFGGKESPEFIRWKSDQKELFVYPHFEYRFTYQLRNYAVHIDSPVAGIYTSQHGDTEIWFYKPFLLTYEKFSSATFANDWSSRKDHFPVTPILKKSFELLKDLFDLFCLITRDIFFNWSDWLIANFRCASKKYVMIGPKNDTSISYMGKPFYFSKTLVPIHEAEVIRQTFNELGSA